MKFDFITAFYEPNPQPFTSPRLCVLALAPEHSSTLYKLGYDEIR